LACNCENPLDTYDSDEGSLDLEFFAKPLVLGGIASQLLIVLITLASFDDARREVL
jgi:hypothetical protein